MAEPDANRYGPVTASRITLPSPLITPGAEDFNAPENQKDHDMAATQQMSGGSTSGSSRYKVGDATVTAVTDGFRTAPLADGFVLNASKDEVNKALEDGGLPRDQLTIVFNPVVIETAGKRVLIDAGMGVAASKAPNATFGFLVDNMKAAGLDPASIDLVIISHFHGDHVNGLWAAPGELAFPNAEITVPEPEWKFWYDDGEMARAPKGRIQDLFASNRKVFDPIKDKVAKHSWEKEVVPGLTAIGTPGHSRRSHLLCAQFGLR